MNAQGRPAIQDLVRMTMEKSASRAQIAAEGSRQLQRSGSEDNTKQASAQDSEVTTDFAEKLANAIEFITPTVLKQAEIEATKSKTPFPTGVTETIDGKNPLWDNRNLGSSKTHKVPLHSPMEHEGKMKTDENSPIGLHTHGQPTSLHASRGKAASEEIEKEAGKAGDAARRFVGSASRAPQAVRGAASKAQDAVSGAASKGAKKVKDALDTVAGKPGKEMHRYAKNMGDRASHQSSDKARKAMGSASSKLENLAKKHDKTTRNVRIGIGAGAAAAAGAGGAALAKRNKEAGVLGDVGLHAAGLANRAAQSGAGKAVANFGKKVLNTEGRAAATSATNLRKMGPNMSSVADDFAGRAKSLGDASNKARLQLAGGVAAAGAAGAGLHAMGGKKKEASEKSNAFGRAVSSLGDRGRKAGVAAWDAAKGAKSSVKGHAHHAKTEIKHKARKAFGAAKDKVEEGAWKGRKHLETAGKKVNEGGRAVGSSLNKHKKTIGIGAGSAAAGAAEGEAHGRHKKAEDAINPARIRAGKAVPPDTMENHERPRVKVDGPTHVMDSVQSAINFTKRDAYGKIKQDNAPYWSEKMLTQSADPVLHEAFKNTARAGAKIASLSGVEKTAEARQLLSNLANQVAGK